MWGTKTDSSKTYYGIATLTNMESAGYVDETGTRCCTWKRLKSWYAKNIDGPLPPAINSGSMNMSVVTGYNYQYYTVLGTYPLKSLFGKSRYMEIVLNGMIYSEVPTAPGWSGTVYFDLYLTFSNSTTSYIYGTDEIYVAQGALTTSQINSISPDKKIEVDLDANSVNGSSLDADIENYTYLMLIAVPKSYPNIAVQFIGKTDDSYYEQYINCSSYALDKCLMGNDFQKKNVTRPWVYRISEGVSGATRARTVTGRLAYKTSSSSSYSTLDIGTWTHSSNVTDGASRTVWTRCNPYNLLNVSDISSYTMRLWFWCGSTKNNQKWYGYTQSRTKSTGTLGTTWSSAVNLTGSGSKSASITYGNDSWDSPFYSTSFKSAMQNYCGVTCRPE